MKLKKLIAAALTACAILTFLPSTSLADSTGWYKTDLGWKYYTYEDGFIRQDWKKVDGKWYYFRKDGIMVAGVTGYYIDGKDYDFADNGVCTTPDGKTYTKPGWYQRCFYSILGDSSDTVEPVEYEYKWSYIDSNGDPIKGWLSRGGKWYYFNPYRGYMLTGRYYIDGNYYYFNDSGEMVTGWYFNGFNWCYATSGGALLTNTFHNIGDKSYYFNKLGEMVSNADYFEIGDEIYSFDKDGVAKKYDTGFQYSSIRGWYRITTEGLKQKWYYNDDNGVRYTGWHKIDGKWYFFGEDGRMYAGEYYQENNNTYYFKKNGEMLTGWYKDVFFGDNYHWIYAASNGVLYEYKWLNEDGKWYYFSDYNDGMYTNGTNVCIDGYYYHFGSDGACLNPYEKNYKFSGWTKFVYTEQQFTQEHWCYYSDSGERYRDKWFNYCGKWYYFTTDAYMCNRSTFKIGDEYYDFLSNGVCLNPDNPRSSDKFYY